MTGGKRKRQRAGHEVQGDQKRQKILGQECVVKHALLARYYQQVSSLREYLLSKLPPTSKIRRKKILSVGRKQDEAEKRLALFLDQTLVGISKNKDLPSGERWRQWTTFSQKSDESTSFVNSNAAAIYSQSEIVDFTIWLLLSKNPSWKNQHILCQGFRKDGGIHNGNRAENPAAAIPGVVSTYPNSHVTDMKSLPWPQVLALMGKEGERAMIDLILDCGVFRPIESGQGTFYQLSGYPLGDLQTLDTTLPTVGSKRNVQTQRPTHRKPTAINFVRNRMMYARAALNAHGKVRFGLNHIHVLNRYPLGSSRSQNGDLLKNSDQSVEESTAQVLMYIFPRQFGLHNVFTGETDSQQTAQPFKDYTIREDEISAKYPSASKIKLPKRLRGAASLVRKLQVQHSRCPYKILLEYYCPLHRPSMLPQTPKASITSSTTLETQLAITKPLSGSEIPDSIEPIPMRKPSIMEHATPCSMVSAFCRAVLARIIPFDFWGTGDVQKHNLSIFYRNVDRFIRLRRFESMSIHEVTQDIRIVGINWLAPPSLPGQKLSLSDLEKRREIFSEFIYYIFDSVLIPLIRSNFHVTESNVYRYRLSYFRHDVWRSLTEPALASLKVTMFEEVKMEQATQILASRTLGFSQVRLLPKATGVRPIMNLKRRCVKKGYKNILGSSINSVLAPVYNVLTLEKKLDPTRLGSTMFSVGDLYAKLKDFKSRFGSSSPFYFAKVDVQAAFDSIPQDAVLALISSLMSESEYRISKHAEIKAGENYRADPKAKPIRKWTALAHPADDFEGFEENLDRELAVSRKNTVFIENVVNQFRDKAEILGLLTEHVQNNLVKIGKRFYRQKEGIPQGSVLSSLLCNYFYADLETSHLSFLKSGDSLLLRLIDDFLLITTNRNHAQRFLQVMHDGVPAYGVTVNPDKTLVNFEAAINGKNLSRAVAQRDFPYCGNLIDMTTLNISKDRGKNNNTAIVDSLTVEYSKVPGKTFQRKVLHTFKIQSHAMFLDTSFNSLPTVISNIRSAFAESATKMCTYISCLPTKKQPGTKLIIRTIEDVIGLAFVLIKSKAKNKKNEGYRCSLSRAQVEWLAINAFQNVLVKRQTKYRDVLGWLGMKLSMMQMRNAGVCEKMRGMIRTKEPVI